MAMMASPALILIFSAGLALGKDEKSTLDMEPDSVDDQYEDCADNMTNLVENTFLTRELNNDATFRESWERGKSSCGGNPGHGLKVNHCIALYVYSDSIAGKAHVPFNEAIRVGKAEYKSGKFKWYSLQFFLTQALQILKTEQSGTKTSFRRTKVAFPKNVVNNEIRFGRFASSSTNKKSAEGYGTTSCFEIKTDHGVAIKEFSAVKGEEEVLIPPYEKFRVTEVLEKAKVTDLWCETVYKLESTGTQSNLNCAVAAGRSLTHHSYQFLWVATVCAITFMYSL